VPAFQQPSADVRGRLREHSVVAADEWARCTAYSEPAQDQGWGEGEGNCSQARAAQAPVLGAMVPLGNARATRWAVQKAVLTSTEPDNTGDAPMPAALSAQPPKLRRCDSDRITMAASVDRGTVHTTRAPNVTTISARSAETRWRAAVNTPHAEMAQTMEANHSRGAMPRNAHTSRHHDISGRANSGDNWSGYRRRSRVDTTDALHGRNCWASG